MTVIENILHYLYLGITHVFPLGFDHMLFMISIIIINVQLKPAIIQCSIFTIAHSISLILSSLYPINISSSFIEPLIAFSILITSLDNILSTTIFKWRLTIIFIFGLIHGLGFANALKVNGIEQNHFITALISFNFGVEIAQLTILFLLFFSIIKCLANKKWYSSRIVFPVSSGIGCIALYWIINLLIL